MGAVLCSSPLGEEESNEVALDMILEKIKEDPQSGSCLNISYSEIAGTLQNSVLQSTAYYSLLRTTVHTTV